MKAQADITQIHKTNICALADTLVLALGDYLRSGAVRDQIDLGIALCEAIARGREIDPQRMTIHQLRDYQYYKEITEDMDTSDLPEKIARLRNTLADIKRNAPVGIDEVKNAQRFLITLSMPFWKRRSQDPHRTAQI